MFYFGYLLIAGCLIHLTTSSNIDCSKEHFLCDSGDQCVKRTKWCDKNSDCEDGSDELYCSKKHFWYGDDPNGCEEKNETHILCGSGICIPIAARCDTYNDCKDNTDEKNCEISVLYNPEPPPTETTRADSNINYDDTSEEMTIASRIPSHKTSFSTTAVTKLSEEDEQESSTTRDTYSSLVDGHLKSSTSYYDKRLRETDSESDHPSRIFPRTVPTRAYRVDHSISQTHSRIFTTPISATKTRSWRPPINVPPSQITYPTRRQQHQNVNPRYNHHQPPVHHNRAPANHHQHPAEHHQPHMSRSQNPSNRYHSLDIRYQPHLNSYPLSSKSYQPSSISNQHSPNSYQQSSNSYQQSSNSYQRSSNSYQSASDSHHPHRPIPNNSHNGHRSVNGQRNSGYQINHFKPYVPEQKVRRPFYFAKDYGSLYGKDKVQSIRNGTEWVLGQRSDSGDWGKDTPRAVVALALSSNDSFFNGDNDGEIIKRRFMIQIGADLLKNNTEDFNINRLFMAINALLAVCEDPTDFHGIDLTEKLRYKIDKTKENKRRSYQNPFVLLSLCLSNKSLTSTEIHDLMNQMSITVIPNERSKDTLIAAILAFSCYVHQSSIEDSNYSRSLRSRLNDAISRLLEYVAEDGSFGSVYTTALAAQALMSTNETDNWEADKTMSFLKHQQRQDGSFGDFLATYWILPALSGRSLLHLRNMNCNPVKKELTPKEILEFVGPKQYVHYSLYFGYPLVNSQSLFLYLPQGINFLDVMRVAEYQDPNFRFSLENNSSKVYSLSGLPNDSEMGQSWHLYVRQASSSYLHDPDRNERFMGDLRSLSPKSREIFIFWYHSNKLE